MDPLTSQNKKVPAVVAFGLVALTLYWCFTYSGPYRYLAELQLKWFHFYSPKLTAMAIILGLIPIAASIKVIFRGAERPVPGTPNPLGQKSALPSVQAAPQSLLQYARYTAAVFLFGFGAWSYWNSTQVGNLQELSADDFGNGTVNSRLVYADVRGHLSGMYVGQNHYLYIPMFAESPENHPVQVLVGVDENRTSKLLRHEADGTITVRGVADKGLAGDVKFAFQKYGVTVADPVWVIHAGREPGSDRQVGLILMVLGVVAGGLIFALNSYRQKKNSAPRTLPSPA